MKRPPQAKVLQTTEAEVCGICFREDDKGGVGDVKWILDFMYQLLNVGAHRMC